METAKFNFDENTIVTVNFEQTDEVEFDTIEVNGKIMEPEAALEVLEYDEDCFVTEYVQPIINHMNWPTYFEAPEFIIQ